MLLEGRFHTPFLNLSHPLWPPQYLIICLLAFTPHKIAVEYCELGNTVCYSVISWIFFFFFIYYLAAPLPTLGYCQKDSLTKLMLISVFYSILDTKVIRSFITREQLLGTQFLSLVDIMERMENVIFLKFLSQCPVITFKFESLLHWYLSFLRIIVSVQFCLSLHSNPKIRHTLSSFCKIAAPSLLKVEGEKEGG